MKRILKCISLYSGNFYLEHISTYEYFKKIISKYILSFEKFFFFENFILKKYILEHIICTVRIIPTDIC